jgi:signal transduction histidine kinase
MHRIVIAILVVFLSASGAQAIEEAGRQAVVAMVKRIQERVKTDGAEPTFKAIADPAVKEFSESGLDPFVFDLNGKLLAGATRALIGKNLIDIKDPDGKYPIRMMVDLAKGAGSGWIEYKWVNPRTQKPQTKSSFIEKTGDYFIGAGMYAD